jgi:hypothetical protein
LKQITVYPSDTVAKWLAAQPRRQAAINSVLEAHIAAAEEQQEADATLLEILAEIAASLALIVLLLRDKQ